MTKEQQNERFLKWASEHAGLLRKVAHNYFRALERFRREPVRRGPDNSDALLEQLYTAIRDLPELDRSLVLLSLDGISYRDIAEIFGISESNVREVGRIDADDG